MLLLFIVASNDSFRHCKSRYSHFATMAAMFQLLHKVMQEAASSGNITINIKSD